MLEIFGLTAGLRSLDMWMQLLPCNVNFIVVRALEAFQECLPPPAVVQQMCSLDSLSPGVAV